jgi:two-component system, NarL family, nitrate/nitrite response regulator NarL
MGIQVLIVSEIRFVGEGLAQSLTYADGFDILDAVEPDAALRSVERRGPDVVLLHISTPTGPRLARTLAAVHPGTSMIALAVEEDEGSIVLWVEAGVAGCVPPNGSLAQVTDAVRLVARGGGACSPNATAVLLRRVARLASSQVPKGLTSREIEIARLVEGGLSNKEIGRALSIALPTVKNHVHNILDKLHVDRRSRIGLGPGTPVPTEPQDPT